MRRSILSSTLLLLLSSSYVAAQTAAGLLADLNALSVDIPNACTATCVAFNADLTACGSSLTTIATCSCAAAFQTDLVSCTTCMTAEMVTYGAQQAAFAATTLADIEAACAVLVDGGVAATPASSTTSATTQATTRATIASQTTASTTASSSASSSSSSSSSLTTNPGPVTVTITSSESGFPVQTKADSVFAGAPKSLTVGNAGWTVLAATVGGVALAALRVF